MFKTEFNISKLIAAYLQGTITSSDREKLFRWMAENPLNREHFEQIYKEQTLHDNLRLFEDADRDAIWYKMMRHMDQQAMSFSKPKMRKMYLQFVAAAMLVILGISLLIVKQQTANSSRHRQLTAFEDVAPGNSGATLTLSNGKQITLSAITKGMVSEESGVEITKSATGELIYELKTYDKNVIGENTLSTANGQTYQIRLPDGSRVWLNAGSSLTYSPTLMKDGKRQVKLLGEAYFEITKDRSKPFVVQTEKQEIEVLGTVFNVNAYSNESVTRTTLLEGGIKIKTKNKERVVRPGEQAITDGQQITIAKIDVENAIDWKNGDFYLNHVDFKEAMRKIARWYDVDIIYEYTVSDDMESGGWISRNRSLSQVVKSIESSGMVKFKIEGRKLYVKRPDNTH